MEERGKAGRHSVSPSLESAILDVLHCFVSLHLFIIEKRAEMAYYEEGKSDVCFDI